MKTIILILLCIFFSQNANSHCSLPQYKPLPRGKLPCGCNYYLKKKFIGRDCSRKPVFVYEKISSHTKCRAGYPRKINYSYNRRTKYKK